mmetsp:Transcript_15188/g.27109  ORF Transcript_15188/g.27109 Transcript_15188/m.27109 type:complete len:214 (+) Transcript_15188:525-1166(+)
MLPRRVLPVIGGVLPEDLVVRVVGRLLSRRRSGSRSGGSRCSSWGRRCSRGGSRSSLPSRGLRGVVGSPLRRIILLSRCYLLSPICSLLLSSIRPLLLSPIITLSSICPLLLSLLSVLIIIGESHPRHDTLRRLFGHDGLDHLLYLLGSCGRAADANDTVHGPRGRCGWDLDAAAGLGLHLLDDTATTADDHADVLVGTIDLNGNVPSAHCSS